MGEKMDNLRWADRNHSFLACEIGGETAVFPALEGHRLWEAAKRSDLSALPEPSEHELLQLDLLAALKATAAARLRDVSHVFGDTPPEFQNLYLLKYELLLSIADPATPEARGFLEANAAAAGMSFEDFAITIARKRKAMVAAAMAIAIAYDAGKRAVQQAAGGDEIGLRQAFDTAMVALRNVEV